MLRQKFDSAKNYNHCDNSVWKKGQVKQDHKNEVNVITLTH